MKKTLSHFFPLVVAAVLLAGCKKDGPDFNVVPKSVIIFDDTIDKASADFAKNGNVTLKIGVTGPATSVKVTSTYAVGPDTKTKDLGTLQLVNGAAMLSVPVASLRNAADGAIIGVGTAPNPLPAGTTATSYSRAGNTYALIVDAVDGGSSDRRYFSAVIVQ